MRNLSILLLVSIVWLMSGCTSHNGGDIGPYFGQWKLTEIYIDGNPDTLYQGNVFWKFQENVVAMLEVYDHHDMFQGLGTWQEEADNMLSMKFIYGDDHNMPGTGAYAPPACTHLPSGEFAMKVLSLESRHMRLSYTSLADTTYVYNLVKW